MTMNLAALFNVDAMFTNPETASDPASADDSLTEQKDARCEAPLSLHGIPTFPDAMEDIFPELCSDVHGHKVFTINRTDFVSNMASDFMESSAGTDSMEGMMGMMGVTTADDNDWCHFNGGGVYAGPGANVLVLRSNFRMNIAQKGGAIYGDADTNWTIIASEFYGNTAEQFGGAVYGHYGSQWTIGDSRFAFNIQVHSICVHAGTVQDTETGTQASEHPVCEGTFDENGGGALYAAAGSTFEITSCVFENCQAEGTGGAIHVEPLASFAMFSSHLIDNFALRTTPFVWEFPDDLHYIQQFVREGQSESLSSVSNVRQALFAVQPFAFLVRNTTTVPFVGEETVSLNVLSGCMQYPCAVGSSCEYINYSTFCTECSFPLVGIDGLSCITCEPGYGPEGNTCMTCQGNTYSTFGFCDACSEGLVADNGHTRCNEMAGATISDQTVVESIMNSTTNLFPKVTLELSANQTTISNTQLIAELTVDISAALELPTSLVKVTDIRGLVAASGRRTQVLDSLPTVAQFDLVLYSDDPIGALATLEAQIVDANSVLRNSTTARMISPTATMDVSFVCRVGTYQPDGQFDCLRCPPTHIPDERQKACQKCPDRQAPNPEADFAECSCAQQYFDSVLQPSCNYMDWHEPTRTGLQCDNCDLIGDCVSHCHESVFDVRPGHATVIRTDHTISFFKCKFEEACPGGNVNNNLTGCAKGYTGTLCGVCESEHRMASSGECISCDQTTTAGVAIAAAVLILLLVVVLVVLSSSKLQLASADAVSAVGDLEELADLQVVAKLMISTMQIISNFSSVFNVQLPDFFANLIGMFGRIFQFNFTLIFGIGCITSGRYVSSMFTNVGTVLCIIGICGTVYFIDRRKMRQDKDGLSALEKAQCWHRFSHRVLIVVFLVYPNLTRSIFEVFICRDLGPNLVPGSVLQVDYAIDCTETWWSRYTMGIIMVLLFPIAAPVGLLVSMYKVRHKLVDGDQETTSLYSFVVGSYKRSHWWWEVVELAKKLALNGIISIVGRGTVAQSMAGTVISFGFFALSLKEQPFERTRLNVVKLISEIQIFGVLLVCTILQAEDADLSAEPLTRESYDWILTTLSLVMFPVVAYVVVQRFVSIQKKVTEVVEGEESSQDAQDTTYANPVLNLVDGPMEESIDSKLPPSD